MCSTDLLFVIEIIKANENHITAHEKAMDELNVHLVVWVLQLHHTLNSQIVKVSYDKNNHVHMK